MSTDNSLKYFYKYINGVLFNVPKYDFREKEKNIALHSSYMLARTRNMFKWNDLPDTIPERIVELYLQTNGNICFTEYKDDLYVFTGGMGGKPNAYYMPTIYIVANPALEFYKTLKIDEDCVVVPNDSMYIGLMPLFSRYATSLVENELTLYLATINGRMVDLISAPDDRTKVSAEKFLSDIEEGKQGVIAENSFLDGIKSQPYGNQNNNIITAIIEEEQYLKACWYNEVGLNANYNMKREAINTAESQLNNDSLFPLVDDMLNCRRTAIEKVNKMFGTNISVELSSSWQDNQEELDTQQDLLEASVDETETKNDKVEDEENDKTEDEEISD